MNKFIKVVCEGDITGDNYRYTEHKLFGQWYSDYEWVVHRG